MAVCKRCGKNAPFGRLNEFGLCANCIHETNGLLYDVERSVANNLIYLKDPANTEDLTRTIRDLTNNYITLSQLSVFGVLGHDKKPKDTLHILEENHDQYYIHLAKQEGKIIEDEVNNLQRKKYQYAKIEKFIIHLQFDFTDMNDKSKLDGIRKKFEKLLEKYQ